MSFDPLFPLLPTAALTVAVAIACAATFLRAHGRGRRALAIALAKNLAIAGIGVALINPVALTNSETSGRKPAIALLIDSSRSMAVPDVSGRSRLSAAKEAVLRKGILSRLNTRFETRLGLFGASVRPVAEPAILAAAPIEPETSLSRAIQDSIARYPDATGIVLLSDGRSTDDDDPTRAASSARDRGIPVFTVCLGRGARGPDRRVVARDTMVVAGSGQSAEIAADTYSSGEGNARAVASLFRNGIRVDSRQVLLHGSGAVAVAFPVRESRAGIYRYTVEISSAPGEVDVSNNTASTLFHVSDLRINVLLVERAPSWNSKFLARALSGDPGVEFTAITEIAPGRFVTRSETALSLERPPSTAGRLAVFDLVILGESGAIDGPELDEYVSRRGGSLLLLQPTKTRGPTSVPDPGSSEEAQNALKRLRLGLASAETDAPATPDHRSARLDTHTDTANETTVSVVRVREMTGHPLAPNRTEVGALAFRRYGAGSVCSLLSSDVWRWALLPPELAAYDECYQDFWGQLVRGLVGQSDFQQGHAVSLTTDRSTYALGETVVLRARFRAGRPAHSPQIAVSLPDGSTRTLGPVTPDRTNELSYHASMRTEQPGDHVAYLRSAGANRPVSPVIFRVHAAGVENANRAADPDAMRRIARAGGGKTLTPDELPTLPERINESRMQLQPAVSRPRTLWDRWWLAALILGALSAEWTLRRRWGMR